MKVLFVNHSQQQCGVYQFGKRVYDLASLSNIVDSFYIEVETESDFLSNLKTINPDVIIYNWYPITMSWLTEEFVLKEKDYKHFFIFHDGFTRKNFDKYLFFGSVGKDIDFPEQKTVILPRPLLNFTGTYSKNIIPTIGSFGFGGWQKGFPELVTLVNDQFDVANINIQMPFAYFGDQYGIETMKIVDRCKELNDNSRINLFIDNTFHSAIDVLSFLANNDINLFLYRSVNQGLSSVIDYALSVKRPIGITNDSMFKHIYRQVIDIDHFSVQEIITNGTKPLEYFYDAWSTNKFVEEFEKLIHEH